MRVAFYHSDKPRERALAASFGVGVVEAGDAFAPRELSPDAEVEDCDLAVMVGVKTKVLWERCKARGVRTLMMDKGYNRRRGGGRVWEYWRVSLDHHQPGVGAISRDYPRDRIAELGDAAARWRRAGSVIILAGSSAKYHAFAEIEQAPTEWAREAVRLIRERSDLPIIYRPKPSWRDARPIAGTRYSPASEGLGLWLPQTHALVTHGSNSCVDALLAGVPSICLGRAAIWSISSQSLDEIASPRLADKRERVRMLACLGYHQWTESEMRAGRAWREIRGWL